MHLLLVYLKHKLELSAVNSLVAYLKPALDMKLALAMISLAAY